MDLFKLTLRRQHIVTTYDAKGKASGTTTTWLEEAHNDLPASLVATYRRQFPDNVVSVEAQPRSYAEPRRSSARTQFEDGASRRRRASPAPSERIEAPMVADYAAAVSKAASRERSV